MKIKPILILLTLLASIFGSPTTMLAQAKKPNILVIWGDDIGLADVSAYSDGLMGFETPNIDRVAKEGIRFLQEQPARRNLILLDQRCCRGACAKRLFSSSPSASADVATARFVGPKSHSRIA